MESHLFYTLSFAYLGDRAAGPLSFEPDRVQDI
jgi:hypothetical protein